MCRYKLKFQVIFSLKWDFSGCRQHLMLLLLFCHFVMVSWVHRLQTYNPPSESVQHFWHFEIGVILETNEQVNTAQTGVNVNALVKSVDHRRSCDGPERDSLGDLAILTLDSVC